MARLPYLEADQVAPEYRDMLKRNTNLHKLLVNSPEMAKAFNGVGSFIRFKSKLDPRLRELAILQVGWLERSEYEFTHHVRIGKEFGEVTAHRRDRGVVRRAQLEKENACEPIRSLVSHLVLSDGATGGLLPAPASSCGGEYPAPTPGRHRIFQRRLGRGKLWRGC